jgi:rare lipoprotein A
VKVTNKSNGYSVVVTINDRGPFVRGRIIDVSPAAARVLGFSGLTHVTVNDE